MRGFKQENVPLPPRVLQHPQSWRLERWLVKPASWVHREQRIATFRSLQNAALEYAHAPRSGKLVNLTLQQNAPVDSTKTPLASIEFCPHSVVFKGICAVCGETAQSLHFAETKNTIERIPVAYESEQLAVSRAEAESRSSVNARHLLESRRLSLVLDLDHTLLHATDDIRAPEFIACFPADADLQSVKAFHLGTGLNPTNSARMHVKLRPHLAHFLQRLSKKFELHIYTMGTRSYAAQIASIIDPEKKLFGGRITSREDFAEGRLNQKSIQRLFPCDDSMVLIVDDREDVWISATGQSFMPNLIRAEPYHFWDGLHEVYDRAISLFGYRNVEGKRQKVSNLPSKTLNEASAGANQDEKEHTIKLDASKPSENGNEVKQTNGIIADFETQSKERQESALPLKADQNGVFSVKVNRPVSPDVVPNATPEDNSEHVVDMQVVGVALNGDSKAKQQNGSSPGQAKPDRLEKLEDEEGSNQTRDQQTCSSKGGTPLRNVPPNGVVVEKVETLSHNTVERKATDNVEGHHLSQQNQEPQNGSYKEESTMQPASSNRALTGKNAFFSGIFSELVSKWWAKDVNPKVANHLPRLADVLENCHARFFSIADQARKASGAVHNGPTKRFRPPADVKKILAGCRREVLRDCVVSFTGVIPTGVDPHNSELWNLAQRLGAQCSLDFENGHTTHLVTSEARGYYTRKYKQAVENGSAFVVSPSWLEHSAFHFERQDEFEYRVDSDDRFKTSEEFKSWVNDNYAKAASACRKRSAAQMNDKQLGDERTPKRRKLDSPSPSVRGSGSRSPVADVGMLSVLSQDEIGAAIEAAFSAE